MEPHKENKEETRGLGKLLESALEVVGAEEVLIREAVVVGNSACVRIPKKHLGKKVKVLILKSEEESEE